MGSNSNLLQRIRKTLRSLTLLSVFLLSATFAYAQAPLQIKGTITDSDGQPLIGVSVSIQGTTKGTISDIDGKYQISARKGNVLEFSCISYVQQEIRVGEKAVLDVVLQNDKELLDEVVVIGYGTQRKVDITGSVASVGEEAGGERVVMDVGQMLAGKVAGVVVNQTSGSPGELSSINIRGNTSLSSSSEPLYVIDGVISTSRDVVPSEIETIDILKDAASTAIYGSEGANGVILITTKKGNKNYTKIDLYAMVGFQNVAKTLPLLNSQQYVEKNYLGSMLPFNLNEIDPGWEPSPNQSLNPMGDKMVFVDDENNYWVMNPNDNFSQYYWGNINIPASTDWQKELYSTALLQDYRLSARGGNKGTTYSVLFGYKDQDGVLYGSSYKEYSLRGNFSQKLGKNVTLTFNASYLGSKRDISQVASHSLMVPPTMRVDQGKGFVEPRVPEQIPAPFSNNPFDIEKNITNLVENNSTTFNGVLQWNIIKGLTLRLSASYAQRSMEHQYFANADVNAGYEKNSVAQYNMNTSKALRTENTLQYSTKLKDIHYLSFLAGFSAYSTKNINRFSGATNFALPNLGIFGMHDGLMPMSPEYKGSSVRGLSSFLRAEYSLKDRYLFKATFRADASSIFAENNKWGYFPSVALGWRISQEPWMKSADWLTNLKLRASYGISGKQAISPYQSLPIASFDNVNINGSDYGSALYFSRLGNKDLKWESTGEYNVGLDFGALDDRITFTMDAYYRKTNDLLYTDPLPGFSGYPSQTRNIGAIENKGLEFSFFFVPVRTNDWEWNLGFNASMNVGKVLALGIKPDKFIDMNGSFTGSAYLHEGERLGQFYGYTQEGVWNSQAELDDAIANKLPYVTKDAHPGYPKFVDLDGNNALTEGDKSVIGNGFPIMTGGLTNRLSWKGLELNFTFLYSYGNEVFNATRMKLENVFEPFCPGSAVMADSWRPNLYHYDLLTGQKGELFLKGNPDSDIPMPNGIKSGKFGKYVPSSAYVEDASFLRLADLTLAYSLPQKLISKAKMSQVKFFVTANNLFVISKYKGYDPEVNTSIGEAAFLAPGLDWFSYPKSRTFSVGLNLTF